MKYEMMFIVKPLEHRALKATIDKVVNLVKGIGTVLNVDEWGKKFLAYEIKGESEGYYVLINFDSEFKMVNHLDRKMYQVDEVIRHMIVWRGGEILGKDKFEEREEEKNDD